MSFILDALKKSEEERLRQQAPTTLELPRGKRQRVMPIWMMTVVLLLAVNVVVVLLMWLRRDDVAAPAMQSVSKPNVTSPAATPVIRKPANQQIRSLEEEASVDVPTTEEVEPEAPATTETPVSVAPLVRRAPVEPEDTAPNLRATPTSASQRVTAGMPTLESLGGHTALDLPELRLDLHVYAADARNRFVFINGKRYHEGETTAEGVSIESITADGVVLSKNGRRFLLPR